MAFRWWITLSSLNGGTTEFASCGVNIQAANTAGLNVKDKQLALTACPSLTFNNMKAALKTIFGETTPQRGADALQVSGDTTDATYYTNFTSRRESRSNLQHQTAVQGANPLDRYGRRTRCAICQSVYHWVKDCPHKNEHAKLTEDERQTEFEDCNITLLSKDTLSNTEIFMVGSLGSAVIDSLHRNSVWRKMA